MATINGMTAEAMLAIRNAVVEGASINGSGHLILTKHDGTTIDAGSVIGPTGAPGATSAEVTAALAAAEANPQQRDWFAVLSSTGQSINFGSSLIGVNWTTESADAHGFHTGSSPDINLVAGAAGIWAVHATVNVVSGPSGAHSPLHGFISVAGTTYGAVSQILSEVDSVTNFGLDGTLICQMDADATVKVYLLNPHTSVAVGYTAQLQMYRISL